MLRSLAIGIIISLLSCGAAHASTVGPDVRGYQERACGFDNDLDGIVGEAGECDWCDGSTTDPDGDGNAERIVYVNCDATGNDDASCGAAGDACSTIGYALETRGPAMAGTEEIIVCFKGAACTLTNEVLPDGKAGSSTVGPFGAQDSSTTYSTNPARLIGWDDDADGCYWPADDGVDAPAGCGAAQTAARITDCGTTGDCYGFVMEGDGTTDFSMAHFEVLNFNELSENPIVSDGTNGAGGANDIGFIKFLNGIERFLAHDLVIDGLLKEYPKCGDTIGIRMYANANLDYIKWSNVRFAEAGGYLFRGGVGNESPDHTGLWMENISYSCHACDGAQCGTNGGTGDSTDYCANGPDVRNGCDFAKMWGDISNVRLIRSVIDGDIDDTWNGNNSSGQAGFVVNDNNRDFKFIDSDFLNWKNHIVMQPDSDGGLTLRSVDEIHIIGCTFDNDSLAEAALKNGSGRSVIEVVAIQPGKAADGMRGVVEDFSIRSSTIKSAGDMKSALFLEGGSVTTVCTSGADIGKACSVNADCAGSVACVSDCPTGGHPGSYVIENVTINADQNFSPASLIQLGSQAGTAPICQQDTYTVRNVVVVGEDPADNRDDCVVLETAVQGQSGFALTWSNIVGDPDCQYHYGSTTCNDIDCFTTAAGGNTANTDECTITFAGDGLHLDTGDTCAKDAGTDLSGSFTRDVDGELFSTWDIGADEPNPAAEGCSTNADCSDANECTDDVCSTGSCTNPNVANGTACGSSTDNDCTNPDTCTSGVCQANNEAAGTSAATQCTDSNDCTADQCNGSGGCQNPALSAGTACGSATDDACTDPDTCNGSGSCQANDATAGTSCDDTLFCNGADTCNGTGTCSHAGDPCTPPTVCNDGGDTCDSSGGGFIQMGR